VWGWPYSCFTRLC